MNKDSAIQYAQNGYKIFPVYEITAEGTCSCNKRENCNSPGKHPRTQRGVKDASSSLDDIKKWWGTWPNANIGMATGEGIVVVDIDGRHNGHDSLAFFELLFGKLTECPTANSGSGDGLHFFFADSHNLGNSTGIAPGIDIRGNGGYVILAPSNHASGNSYCWKDEQSLFDIDLPQIPNWLVTEILKSKGSTNKSQNNSSRLPFWGIDIPKTGPIPKGMRNDSLFKLGCSLRSMGLDTEKIRVLLENENKRCEPPLTAGEIASIAGSITRYEPGRNAVKEGMKINSQFNLVTLEELLNSPEEEQDFLVEDLLISGGTSIFGGKPKVGKTTLVRYLALCISQGAPFLGKKVKKGSVIYLALEEKASEIKKHFESMGADGSEQILFHASSAPFKGALDQLRELISKHQPSLVIVDTLFRLIRVEDANNYASMSNELEPLLHMARETGTHILLVHHEKKGGGEGSENLLGSSAIAGMVDAIISIRREGTSRSIQSEQRYGTDIPKTMLCFDQETRTFELGNSIEKQSDLDISGAILAVMTNANAPMTQEQLFKLVPGRKQSKTNALKTLTESRVVEKAGDGKRGSPLLYSIVRASAFLVPEREPFSGTESSPFVADNLS